MIDSRLNPKTTSASCQVPLSSGPRCRAQRIACPTAVGAGGRIAGGGEQSQQSAHGEPVCPRATRDLRLHPTGQSTPSPLVSTRGRRPGVTGAANGWEAASSEPSTARGEPSWFGGRVVRLVALTALVAPFTAGCSVEDAIRFGWPVGVTPQAEAMRHLWTWSGIAALVVGVITWGAMFWAMIFHRKRKGTDPTAVPRQTQYNLPVEMIFTVVPAIIVAVLFGFTVTVQNYVEDNPPNPDLKVDVTAFQWQWKFAYTDTRARTGSRSAPSARATRSRCWCCPRTRPSSSRSTPTT